MSRIKGASHKPLRVTYLAAIRLPTEKAHGLQIMKTCEALADLGCDLTLIVTDRRGLITEDPFDYYSVRRNFTIQRVASLESVRYGKVGFLAHYAAFSILAALAARSARGDIMYGRDELTLLAGLFFTRSPVIWESHTGSWNIAARIVARRAEKIVAISHGVKELYVKKGVDARKVWVIPDGIDPAEFSQPEQKTPARTRLGLPQEKKVALYVGRLDGWKGVDTLCKAADFIREGTVVAVIGGEENQVAEMHRKHPNVVFLGYRPYRELADNQSAADVLVLPNTGKDEVSARMTSPLKLFSYMASGVPIVASDLPSIREILDDDSCYFVPADNPIALAAGIDEAIIGHGAERKAHAARVKSMQYTWAQRAKSILSATQS